jgi:two-component system response regulator YesN
MGSSDLSELQTWFLNKITDACQLIIGNQQEKAQGTIDQAVQYIKTHYQKDISLVDVSRQVDVSPYYFSKIFKDSTGENFIDYLTNLRMEKAKALLKETDSSIKEICVQVGYSEPNYFSRTFKKNVGVTPTEYKEGIR